MIIAITRMLYVPSKIVISIQSSLFSRKRRYCFMRLALLLQSFFVQWLKLRASVKVMQNRNGIRACKSAIPLYRPQGACISSMIFSINIALLYFISSAWGNMTAALFLCLFFINAEQDWSQSETINQSKSLLMDAIGATARVTRITPTITTMVNMEKCSDYDFFFDRVAEIQYVQQILLYLPCLS